MPYTIRRSNHVLSAMLLTIEKGSCDHQKGTHLEANDHARGTYPPEVIVKGIS
jgi:hypothetical protein